MDGTGTVHANLQQSAVVVPNNKPNNNSYNNQNNGQNEHLGHHLLTPITNSTMRALGTLTDHQSLLINSTTITMQHEGNNPGSNNTRLIPVVNDHHSITNGNHQLVNTLELHPDIVLGNHHLLSDNESAEDRPHICEICNATYKTRTHLRRHMFIHLKSRPYPCNDCGKGFNRKGKNGSYEIT